VCVCEYMLSRTHSPTTTTLLMKQAYEIVIPKVRFRQTFGSIVICSGAQLYFSSFEMCKSANGVAAKDGAREP